MKTPSFLASSLCLISLVSSAHAGMLGTSVSLAAYKTDSTWLSLVNSLPTVTITDPGAEYNFSGLFYADFTDTGLTLQYLVRDWNSDEITFVFTDATAGAFTGLSLASNTFPAPNATGAPITTQPTFTNTGTAISFNCCSPSQHFDTTNFTATFSGISPTGAAEPSTFALVGLVAFGTRHRLRQPVRAPGKSVRTVARKRFGNQRTNPP